MNSLDKIAENYVKLALTMNQIDSIFVDAYHGPKHWSVETGNNKKSLIQIIKESEILLNELKAITISEFEPIVQKRIIYLDKHILALHSRAKMLSGEFFSFDRETKLIYDVKVPKIEDEIFLKAIMKLDSFLDGSKSISERVNKFLELYTIPREKLDEAFITATKEAKKRTVEHIDIPKEENFTLGFTSDKPWGAYNYYKGNYTSHIDLNTDRTWPISSIINIAAHEGYPGHHVHGILKEKCLYRQKGWIEFSLITVYTPSGFLGEGIANYGIDIAFPKQEKIGYEKEILLPLLGLESSILNDYYTFNEINRDLRYVPVEVARMYFNKENSRDEILKWIMNHSTLSSDRAEQTIKFVESFRSFGISQSIAYDLIKNYMNTQANSWKSFEKLLSEPEIPSILLEN